MSLRNPAHLRAAHRLATLGAAAVAALVLASCSQRDAGLDGANVPRHDAMTGPIDTSKVILLPVAPDSIAAIVRASGGKATLINVWASWCEPCRMEFPNVIRLARTYKDRGLRVIFISADLSGDLPAARQFLADEGVGWTTYYKHGNDAEFFNALEPRWTGTIPVSFLYDEHGQLKDFWEGAMNYEGFEQRVLPVLSLSQSGGS
jgi:thiol-disulfide isomerase/thioredoxin